MKKVKIISSTLFALMSALIFASCDVPVPSTDPSVSDESSSSIDSTISENSSTDETSSASESSTVESSSPDESSSSTDSSTVEESSGSEETHTHTFSDSWTSDETNHWHVATCEHTDEVSDKEAHDYNVVTTAATCTEKGSTTYTCKVCGYSYTSEIAELNHNYEYSEIIWSGYTAKAIYVCANDNKHKEEHACEVTSAVTTAATCTETGVKTYTATYDGHTSTREEEIPAINHNYEYGEIVWDGFSAKAIYVCVNDNTHKEEHNCEVTNAITTQAACEENGVRTYTATYDGHTSTKTEEIPAISHSYKYSEIVWSGYEAKAIYVCENDNKHKEEHDCEVTSEITKAATCTETGIKTYTATYDGHTSIKEEVIDAINHNYEYSEIIWNGYEAKAIYVCENDNTHKEEHDCVVTSEVTTAATVGATGVRTYTATYDGHTSTREEEIPKINPNYEYSEIVWNGFTAKAIYICIEDNNYKEEYDCEVTNAITTQPTCEEKGIRTYTATYDGHSATKTEDIEAINHNYKYSEIVWDGFTAKAIYVCENDNEHTEEYNCEITSVVTTAATCEETGIRTYTATYDGQTSTKTEEILALNHNYEFSEIIWNGYEAKAIYVCANDSEHTEEHDCEVTSVETTPATCTETGVRTYTATYDGHTVTKTEEIPALNHKYVFSEIVWTDYTAKAVYVCANDNTHKVEYTCYITSEITEDATCTETGVRTYTASYAGFISTQEEVINALGHDYISVVVDPTCEEGGYTAHTCINCGDYYEDNLTEATGHKFEEEWTYDSGYHWHEATCGHDEEVSGEAEHDYEDVVTNPTCTEEGYTTHTCKVCGYSYVDSYTDATGHAYSSEWTSDGTHHWHTATCEHSELIGNKAEHDYNITTVNPTCTEAGYTTYTCKVCGYSYTEDGDPATGHTYSSDWSHDTEGHWHDATCSHESETSGYAIHDYEDVVTNPTCTTQGYTTHTCKVCGYSYIDSYTAATGHVYSEDWSHDEMTHWHSATCGHDLRSDEEAHDYNAVVTAPTCTTQGYTTYTCKDCGYSYVGDYVAATGHAYSSEWSYDNGSHWHEATCEHTTEKGSYDSHSFIIKEVVAATCEHGGYTVYECSVCHYTYTGNITTKLTHSVEEWTETNRVLKSGCCCTYIVTYSGTCELCGETITRTEEVVCHDLYTVIETEATCMTSGVKKEYCSNEDCEYHTTAYSTKEYTAEDGIDYHHWVKDEVNSTSTITYYYCDNDDEDGHQCSATKQTINSTGKTATATGSDVSQVNEIELKNNSTAIAIGMDDDVKENISTTAGENSVNFSAETLTQEQVNTAKASLSEEDQAKLGENPVVYNFTVTTGATTISDLGGTVTVRIAYTLGDNDPNNIIVWYINNGVITPIRATYANGYVTFTTTHFSDYTVSEIAPEDYCYYYEVHGETETIAATCTEDGYTVCKRCGEIISTTPATGHNYESEVTTPATCTTNGVKTYTCSHCHDTYTEVIEALGHDYQEKEHVDSTCTVAGHITYECSHCHNEYTVYLALEEHDYEETVIAPTCTTAGYTLHECSVCGHSYKDNLVEKLGHNEQHVDAKEATCTEDGYTEGIYCDRCEKYIEGHDVISATGHTYTKVVTRPTCEHGGYTTYTCHCGDTYKTDYTEKLEHIYNVVTVNPTCTTQGYTIYTCILCGETHTEYEEAYGHDYSEEYVSTRNGHYHVCNICGAHSEIEAHESDYEEATTEHGIHCTICGYEIASISTHTHGVDVTKVTGRAATCTEEGQMTYYLCSCGQAFLDKKCTRPIESEEDIYIAPTGHIACDHGTLFNDGHMEGCCHYHICEVCGEEFDIEECSGGSATCQEYAICEVCHREYGLYADHEFVDGECIYCHQKEAEVIYEHTWTYEDEYSNYEVKFYFKNNGYVVIVYFIDGEEVDSYECTWHREGDMIVADADEYIANLYFGLDEEQNIVPYTPKEEDVVTSGLMDFDDYSDFTIYLLNDNTFVTKYDYYSFVGTWSKFDENRILISPPTIDLYGGKYLIKLKDGKYVEETNTYGLYKFRVVITDRENNILYTEEINYGEGVDDLIVSYDLCDYNAWIEYSLDGVEYSRGFGHYFADSGMELKISITKVVTEDGARPKVTIKDITNYYIEGLGRIYLHSSGTAKFDMDDYNTTYTLDNGIYCIDCSNLQGMDYGNLYFVLDENYDNNRLTFYIPQEDALYSYLVDGNKQCGFYLFANGIAVASLNGEKISFNYSLEETDEGLKFICPELYIMQICAPEIISEENGWVEGGSLVPQIESIDYSEDPYLVVGEMNEGLLNLVLNYDDGSSKCIPFNSVTIVSGSIDFNTCGTYEITVEYKGITQDLVYVVGNPDDIKDYMFSGYSQGRIALYLEDGELIGELYDELTYTYFNNSNRTIALNINDICTSDLEMLKTGTIGQVYTVSLNYLDGNGEMITIEVLLFDDEYSYEYYNDTYIPNRNLYYIIGEDTFVDTEEHPCQYVVGELFTEEDVIYYWSEKLYLDWFTDDGYDEFITTAGIYNYDTCGCTVVIHSYDLSDLDFKAYIAEYGTEYTMVTLDDINVGDDLDDYFTTLVNKINDNGWGVRLYKSLEGDIIVDEYITTITLNMLDYSTIDNTKPGRQPFYFIYNDEEIVLIANVSGVEEFERYNAQIDNSIYFFADGTCSYVYKNEFITTTWEWVKENEVLKINWHDEDYGTLYYSYKTSTKILGTNYYNRNSEETYYYIDSNIRATLYDDNHAVIKINGIYFSIDYSIENIDGVDTLIIPNYYKQYISTLICPLTGWDSSYGEEEFTLNVNPFGLVTFNFDNFEILEYGYTGYYYKSGKYYTFQFDDSSINELYFVVENNELVAYEPEGEAIYTYVDSNDSNITVKFYDMIAYANNNGETYSCRYDIEYGDEGQFKFITDYEYITDEIMHGNNVYVGSDIWSTDFIEPEKYYIPYLGNVSVYDNYIYICYGYLCTYSIIGDIYCIDFSTWVNDYGQLYFVLNGNELEYYQPDSTIVQTFINPTWTDYNINFYENGYAVASYADNHYTFKYEVEEVEEGTLYVCPYYFKTNIMLRKTILTSEGEWVNNPNDPKQIEGVIYDGYHEILVGSLSTSDLIFRVQYDDNSYDEITYNDLTILDGELNLNECGTYNIEYKYRTYEGGIGFTVVAATDVASVSLNDNSIILFVDENNEIDYTFDRQIKVTYYNGSYEYIDITKDMIEYYELIELEKCGVGNYCVVTCRYQGEFFTLIVVLVDDEYFNNNLCNHYISGDTLYYFEDTGEYININNSKYCFTVETNSPWGQFNYYIPLQLDDILFDTVEEIDGVKYYDVLPKLGYDFSELGYRIKIRSFTNDSVNLSVTLRNTITNDNESTLYLGINGNIDDFVNSLVALINNNKYILSIRWKYNNVIIKEQAFSQVDASMFDASEVDTSEFGSYTIKFRCNDCLGNEEFIPVLNVLVMISGTLNIESFGEATIDGNEFEIAESGYTGNFNYYDDYYIFTFDDSSINHLYFVYENNELVALEPDVEAAFTYLDTENNAVIKFYYNVNNTGLNVAYANINGKTYSCGFSLYEGNYNEYMFTISSQCVYSVMDGKYVYNKKGQWVTEFTQLERYYINNIGYVTLDEDSSTFTTSNGYTGEYSIEDDIYCLDFSNYTQNYGQLYFTKNGERLRYYLPTNEISQTYGGSNDSINIKFYEDGYAFSRYNSQYFTFKYETEEVEEGTLYVIPYFFKKYLMSKKTVLTSDGEWIRDPSEPLEVTYISLNMDNDVVVNSITTDDIIFTVGFDDGSSSQIGYDDLTIISGELNLFEAGEYFITYEYQSYLSSFYIKVGNPTDIKSFSVEAYSPILIVDNNGTINYTFTDYIRFSYYDGSHTDVLITKDMFTSESIEELENSEPGVYCTLAGHYNSFNFEYNVLFADEEYISNHITNYYIPEFSICYVGEYGFMETSNYNLDYVKYWFTFEGLYPWETATYSIPLEISDILLGTAEQINGEYYCSVSPKLGCDFSARGYKAKINVVDDAPEAIVKLVNRIDGTNKKIPNIALDADIDEYINSLVALINGDYYLSIYWHTDYFDTEVQIYDNVDASMFDASNVNTSIYNKYTINFTCKDVGGTEDSLSVINIVVGPEGDLYYDYSFLRNNIVLRDDGTCSYLVENVYYETTYTWIQQDKTFYVDYSNYVGEYDYGCLYFKINSNGNVNSLDVFSPLYCEYNSSDTNVKAYIYYNDYIKIQTTTSNKIFVTTCTIEDDGTNKNVILPSYLYTFVSKELITENNWSEIHTEYEVEDEEFGAFVIRYDGTCLFNNTYETTYTINGEIIEIDLNGYNSDYGTLCYLAAGLETSLPNANILYSYVNYNISGYRVFLFDNGYAFVLHTYFEGEEEELDIEQKMYCFKYTLDEDDKGVYINCANHYLTYLYNNSPYLDFDYGWMVGGDSNPKTFIVLQLLGLDYSLENAFTLGNFNYTVPLVYSIYDMQGSGGKELSYSNLDIISGYFNPNEVGTYTIRASYDGYAFDFVIYIVERKPTSIVCKEQTDEFDMISVVEGCSPDNLIYIVTYDDGSTEEITFNNFEIVYGSIDFNTPGDYNLDVMYDHTYINTHIIVNRKSITDYYLISDSTIVVNSIDYSDIKYQLTFNDETSIIVSYTDLTVIDGELKLDTVGTYYVSFSYGSYERTIYTTFEVGNAKDVLSYYCTGMKDRIWYVDEDGTVNPTFDDIVNVTYYDKTQETIIIDEEQVNQEELETILSGTVGTSYYLYLKDFNRCFLVLLVTEEYINNNSHICFKDSSSYVAKYNIQTEANEDFPWVDIMIYATDYSSVYFNITLELSDLIINDENFYTTPGVYQCGIRNMYGIDLSQYTINVTVVGPNQIELIRDEYIADYLTVSCLPDYEWIILDTSNGEASWMANMLSNDEMNDKWQWLYQVIADVTDDSELANPNDDNAYEIRSYMMANLYGIFSETQHQDTWLGTVSADWSLEENINLVINAMPEGFLD